MSLKHILLGLININSMTGYDLKQVLDETINNFWSVNLSQIYPALNEMNVDGLLDMEVQINETTPNSKIYHITEKGRSELKKWLEETTPLPQTRKLFFAKLLIAAKFDKEIMISQLKEQMALHQEMLAFFRKRLEITPYRISYLEGPEKHKLIYEIIIDSGIKEEEAAVEWCRAAIERLEQSDFYP